MSTHNLCFGAKIRKIGVPLHTPVLLYKSGVQGDVHCTDISKPHAYLQNMVTTSVKFQENQY